MIDILKLNSKPYGEFYCNEVSDFFEEGEKLTIYSHHSYRLYAISKSKKIYRVHYTDFGTIFFTTNEWRNKKINQVLKK